VSESYGRRDGGVGAPIFGGLRCASAFFSKRSSLFGYRVVQRTQWRIEMIARGFLVLDPGLLMQVARRTIVSVSLVAKMFGPRNRIYLFMFMSSIAGCFLKEEIYSI
jgi:hypothetical protein